MQVNQIRAELWDTWQGVVSNCHDIQTIEDIFREIKKPCTDIHRSQEFDLLYNN